MIWFYLKISVNFERFIRQDGFCFMHILFGRLVKLQFLAQIPTDTFPTQSFLVLYSFSYIMLYLLINHFTPWEFSTPVWAVGPSLESEWELVSSALQNSEYSGQCQQSCSLNSLDSSLIFKLYQSWFRFFMGRSKYINDNWYHCHPHILHYIIIYSFRIFHISISRWFFTGVWVTASLLKSPGFVSGFWPFSAMLSFG